MSDFDRLARAYRWLEYLAFGGVLQRARTVYLPRLRHSRHILVIGDGDGRCVAALAALAPSARIHCIDTSAAMLAAAARRLPIDARARVSFERADVRTYQPVEASVDAVVTMFMLDCLTAADVQRVVGTLARSLRPGGQWLFADFVLPPSGWRRVRARIWITSLYRLFRWTTGLEVTTVPPSERLIADAGLVVVADRTYQAGMVRSVRFEKPSARVDS